MMAAEDSLGGQFIDFAGLRLQVPHDEELTSLAHHLEGVHGTNVNAHTIEPVGRNKTKGYLHRDMMDSMQSVHTLHHEFLEEGKSFGKKPIPMHSREDRSPG